MARTARDVARQVVRRVATDNAFISRVLDAEIAAACLSERDRRLATELAYGVCRNLIRLDRAVAAKTRRGMGKLSPAIMAILRVAAYEILFLDRVPDHAAVSQAARAARKIGGSRMAGFANGVLRSLARDGEPDLPPESDARRHIEVAHSLPGWIADRLSARFTDPAELLAAARALCEPAPLAIRVNTARIDRAALVGRLRADHPRIDIAESVHCPHAFLLSGLGDPERSPSLRGGLWTVQDVGAQLVSHFVAAGKDDPKGKLRLLDACAGVGGKATHLAQLYGQRATIHAADHSQRKLARLAETATRLGISTIEPRAVDLTRPADGDLASDYDAVLLDAPCTGLGVLRRHPEARWRLTEADIARMATIQRDLLDNLAGRVRPGGVLVYSVCTFTRAEGRDQIAAFLARHPEFALAAPPAEAAPESDRCDSVSWPELCPEPGILETWPHRHGADSFFAARMVVR